MPQFDKGETFADGQLVTGDRLNNHVTNAKALKGVITEQESLTASGNPLDVETDKEHVTHLDRILVYDESSDKLRQTTVSNMLYSGNPIGTELVEGANLTVRQVEGQLSIGNPLIGLGEDADVVINGNTLVSGNYLTVSDTLNVGGRAFFNSSYSMKIPTGTTEERPDETSSPPVQMGEIRYNSTLLRAEVFNGTEWKELGGSPFDASGGSFVLAPSTVETAATFTSTDSGKDVVITIPDGHDYCMGQVVELKTAISGYSGEYVATSVGEFTIGFRRTSGSAAIVINAACTVRKSGNHKVHVFKQTGNFVVGNEDGIVDILIVGGGGGQGDGGRWNVKGGGSGAVLLKRGVKVQKNTTYQCVVGSGGSWEQDGGNSEFKISGQAALSLYYATGGTRGYQGQSGKSGYTSDNAHLPDDERRRLGTSYPDWANWVNNGAGAGAGQSVSIRNGSDYGWRPLDCPVGVVSDITNIPIMYAHSGGSPEQVYKWHPSLSTGMKSSVESKGFEEMIGVGATSRTPDATAFRPQNGKIGIVIVRYPYKLQQ